MKLHEDKTLFTQLLNFVANALNIRPEFIEKDYWLTRALQRMAQNQNTEKVVFKGGTGWQTKAIKDSPLLTEFPALWIGLKSSYQSELTPLAFSEIPNEKLIEESFIRIMEKL